jgi:hypothetical protein
LPTDINIIENTQKLALIYRKFGKDISSTDFILGAALKKYVSSGVLLLTRDHGDFPIKIFDRDCIVPIESVESGVHTYLMLRYSLDKEYKIYEKLLETEARNNN